MAHVPFPAKLSQIKSLTPLIRELEFRYEGTGPNFQTGQFYMMHVPTDEGVVKRAYSIASSHHDKHLFRFIIKLVPAGIASGFVEKMMDKFSEEQAAGLPLGPTVEFTGPFGKCVFQTPPRPRILFLCTGAGLAQHYSMIVSEREVLRDRRAHLLLGVWNLDEIFYKLELEKLRETLPNFTFEYVLDKPAAGWTGKVGYITQFISEFSPTPADTTIYACGNPDMVKGVKKLLLDELGFSKDQFLAESFTHSSAPSSAGTSAPSSEGDGGSGGVSASASGGSGNASSVGSSAPKSAKTFGH